MLVLSRRKYEGVVIGDEVTLTVEEISDSDDGRRISGASVRLGFQSPRYVSIYRDDNHLAAGQTGILEPSLAAALNGRAPPPSSSGAP